MTTRREQLEYVTSIKINENERKSINCPFCGGHKKFTISNQDGKLLWNCFKASCTAKGAHRIGHSLEAIKSGSYSKKPLRQIQNPMPEILGRPSNYPKVIQYLKDNNCWEAYQNKLCNISYDPKEDRVLFHINNVGAVGRSLAKKLPKWISYGDVSSVFTVGNSPTCIIVEDPASACSVGSTGVYTGCAILGTSVSCDQLTVLRKYNEHYICLDKDASKIALALYENINFPNVKVRLLTDDLKYLGKNEIMEVINHG